MRGTLPRPASPYARAASLALAVVALGHLAGAQSLRLNGPLVVETVADVVDWDFRETPDGARVIYRGAFELGGDAELYSVPVGGGAVTRLNAELPAGRAVASFEISASGASVVYAEAEGLALRDLWIVPAAGGAATKLNQPIVEAHDYSIDPTGTRLVFVATASAPYQLFSVSIAGGAPVQLSTPGHAVTEHHFSPDGARVVYHSAYGGASHLHSVPIAGGAVVQLNSPSLWVLGSARIAADGSRVAFVAQDGLQSVPIAGGALTTLYSQWNPTIDPFDFTPDGTQVVFSTADELLSIPAAGGTLVQLSSYPAQWLAISPDSQRVVFAVGGGIFALGSVPVAGGDVVQLGYGIGGSVGYCSLPAISPDSSRVVFVQEPELDGHGGLYSVPIGGGSATRLDPALDLVFSDQALWYRISPDSSRVVYDRHDGLGIAGALVSVAMDTGTAVQLLGQPVGSQFFSIAPGFAISSGGSAVLYARDGLHSVPIGGGASTLLNESAPVPVGDVAEFVVSPDGERALYVADEDQDEVLELYGASLERPAAPVVLSAPLVAGGDVRLGSARFSPDGSRALYLADANVDERVELFSVPSAGGAVVGLNPPPAAPGRVWAYRVDPASTQVVYDADRVGGAAYRALHAVPIGGGASVRITPTMAFNRHFYAYEISPDGARVVYLADADTLSIPELWSVPIGGGTATKLNPALPATARVQSFAIHRTSGWVAYLADALVAGRFELFGVPLAGGFQERMNSTPATGGDVLSYAFGAVGTARIYYLADQTTDEVVELYGSTYGPGGNPAKLSAPLVAGGDVASFRALSSDDSLVYLADQSIDGTQELYWMPGSGGTRIQVSAPLPAGRSVTSFEIAESQLRVVYRSDAGADEVYGLTSADLAGSGHVDLTPSLGAGRSVSSYQVDPATGDVAYVADAHADDVHELFGVPLAGGRARKLSRPLFAGDGAVAVESFHAFGGRVVYRACQSAAEVFELFLSYQDRSRPRGR